MYLFSVTMRKRIQAIVVMTLLIVSLCSTYYIFTLPNIYRTKPNSIRFTVASLLNFRGRHWLSKQNSTIASMMHTIRVQVDATNKTVPGKARSIIQDVATSKTIPGKAIRIQDVATSKTVPEKAARCSPASSDGCITCLYGYHGKDCGIPPEIVNATRLETPRRIIQAFPINHEIDLLEIRLIETSTLTDLFVILESNYSAYGDKKSLHLLNNNKHLLVKYNIMHILLDHFPKGGRKNGWIADGYLRSYMSSKMLEVLDPKKWKGSDIFVLFDADEIPDNNLLWFLKHYEYDNYLLGIAYKQYIFAAFWLAGTTKTTAVTTLDRLKHKYNGNAYKIRGTRTSVYIHSGWHCSWCLKPVGIRTKLTSAQNGDFPRWGDFPAKLNLSYIYGLVIRGESFAGKSGWRRVRTADVDIPNAMRISPRWKYLWDYQWWISNKNSLYIG